jgi:hypothetical protein
VLRESIGILKNALNTFYGLTPGESLSFGPAGTNEDIIA